MAAFRLLARLVIYYAVLGGVLTAAFVWWPDAREFLPMGRAEGLISDVNIQTLGQPDAANPAAHARPIGTSVIWLFTAVLGALAAALPVSWVYMQIRNPHDYDQSVIDTIVVLPLVVTGIVVVVQHSLALAFSLAGIAGAARFRNNMKSSGDLLFILLAIGIGLSVGIGALELALVVTAVFNLAFVALWFTNYGERAEMKRFMSEFDPDAPDMVATTTVSTEVTETVEVRKAGEAPAKG